MNNFADRFRGNMIAILSQYVIGSTRHNESMLVGLFKQKQFADERVAVRFSRRSWGRK